MTDFVSDETLDGLGVRATLLEEAELLVNGPRQEAYGHPFDNFGRAGRMWGAILGIADVTPEQVALCMVALKMSRECHQPGDDNVVDAMGYLDCLGIIKDRRARS